MAGIAPNILSDRLRRLERAGILVATPYSRRPLRMEYALTADGRELAGALHLLADWGARRGGTGEPLRHEVCGTPLEAALALPHLRAPGRRRRARRADARSSGRRRARAGSAGSAADRQRVERPGPLRDGIGAQAAGAMPSGWSTIARQPPLLERRAASPAAAATRARVLQRQARAAPGAARDARSAAATDGRAARVRPTAGAGAPRAAQDRRRRRPASGSSAATIACQVRPRSARSGGSTKASGCSGSSARRRATSAAARAGAAGSSTSQSGQGADDDGVGAAARRGGRAPRRAAAARARGPPGWPGRTARRARGPAPRAAGPAGTSTRVPARHSRRWAKTWSASARSGSTRPVTISRIGSATTTSIRSNAATTAWSGAASGRASVISRT